MEGEDGVGADHAGAGGVDGPGDEPRGFLLRHVGNIGGAVGRVVGPVEGGVEAAEGASEGVEPVVGEGVVEAVLGQTRYNERKDQTKKDGWPHESSHLDRNYKPKPR